jgi:dihydroorotase
LHLSTAQSAALVRAAKADGVRVTAECTPQHLVLTDETCASFDPVFKMNPPLREPVDVDALRAALADGTIDAIATDHAPHAPEAKDVPFEEAPPGMLGVETALAVVLTTLVTPGLLSLEQALRALSWTPSRIAGLDGHGGPIAPGRPAHLCVLDPAHRWVVDADRLASRSRNSPWEGWKLTGKVRHTVLGGVPTVRNGEAQK